MKVSIAIIPLLVTFVSCIPLSENGGGAHGGGKPHHPSRQVNSKSLRSLISESALVEKAEKLEAFSKLSADYPNRLTGSIGSNATVAWIYDTIAQSTKLLVNGIPTAFLPAFGGRNVNSVAELVPVSGLGCAITDFPQSLNGKIALISQGSCTFETKSGNAGSAGAIGVIIYKDVDGACENWYSEDGDYPITFCVTKAVGEAYLHDILAGIPQVADMSFEKNEVEGVNVIAETLGGDHDNIVHFGAHSDAFWEGINDNGSGVIALLEIALQLTKFKTNNAIRFSWWGAEEFGLVGSTSWVDSQADSELDKIRAYLNFDMIASPNYVYGIYDGDGSTFNTTGAKGAKQIEALFEDYFHDIEGVASVPVPFNSRSDYYAFQRKGIACGGLFTGAENIKTEEEARLFGGEAGVAYDVNYHGPGDDLANVNREAWLVNTRAIAHVVAVLGKSTRGLNKV